MSRRARAWYRIQRARAREELALREVGPSPRALPLGEARPEYEPPNATQRELALELGLTPQAVSHIETAAIAKLRRRVTRDPRFRDLRDLLHEVSRADGCHEPETLWDQTIRAFSPGKAT